MKARFFEFLESPFRVGFPLLSDLLWFAGSKGRQRTMNPVFVIHIHTPSVGISRSKILSLMPMRRALARLYGGSGT